VAETALNARGTAPKALLFGGETTVRVTGTGIGGRNQELALRVALMGSETLQGSSWVFLSGGTDGRDGPTEAAGGLVDASSADRIHLDIAEPAKILFNNDSHRALRCSNDLLITGATGTNVADIHVFLLGEDTKR
jgi:hydroxypyruvate reductase